MKNLNILITGAGEIGYQLARRLSEEQYDITIIESDPEKARYVKQHIDAYVITGSGTSQSTLEEANIREMDVIAALTNNDEGNILTCAIAKQYGVETTIARVRNSEFISNDFILRNTQFAPNYYIQPELLAANSIVSLIRQASATDIVKFHDGKIQLVGIRLDRETPILNTPLKELGTRYGNPPIRIIAIKRGQFTIIPRGDDMFIRGDQMFMISSPEYMSDALEYLGKKDTRVENIMIIGGGQIGRFVAQELEKEINIKIIEQNEQKSIELASNLGKSLVLKGDGSDVDLLVSEGLPDMDEFIALTGDDETNIISSIVARHMRVPRTITLLRKQEYLPLTHTIGMDAVVSKEQITVNEVQKIIRSSQVAFYAELPGVDAEITEYIAVKGSRITRKPVMELKFPQNAILGAIIKPDNSLVIPTGTTMIEPADKVIVFSLPKAKASVEKFF